MTNTGRVREMRRVGRDEDLSAAKGAASIYPPPVLNSRPKAMVRSEKEATENQMKYIRPTMLSRVTALVHEVGFSKK